MREILVSEECIDFIDKYEGEIRKKYLYLLQILIEQKVVHSSFVKKLINTSFYELRISVNSEYRILMFACNQGNFNESKQTILLNGFLKKNKKDYKKAVKIAELLMDKYKEECNE